MATFCLVFFSFQNVLLKEIEQEIEEKNKLWKDFRFMFTDDSGFIHLWVACNFDGAASEVHWPCGQK